MFPVADSSRYYHAHILQACTSHNAQAGPLYSYSFSMKYNLQVMCICALRSVNMLQVYDNVDTAVSAITAEEKETLAHVRGILAPIHNMTWPSGRPENN